MLAQLHPTTMDAHKDNTDSDDSTEDEEVEEQEVFVELDNKQEFGNDPHIQFLGLDQEKPMLNINGVTYQGSWEDALGTLLLLEESLDEPSPHSLLKDNVGNLFTVKHKVDKILKMSRCVLVKNQEVYEDLRTVIKRNEGLEKAESSEEENLDEYYSAVIEPKNPSKTSQNMSQESTSTLSHEEAVESLRPFSPRSESHDVTSEETLIKPEISQMSTESSPEHNRGQGTPSHMDQCLVAGPHESSLLVESPVEYTHQLQAKPGCSKFM